MALSGSLPKGAPTSFYAELVREIQGSAGGRAVLDTSGAAFEEALQVGVVRCGAVWCGAVWCGVTVGRCMHYIRSFTFSPWCLPHRRVVSYAGCSLRHQA